MVKGRFHCPVHGGPGLSNLFNILDSLMLYKSQFYFRPCVGRICQSLAYENPAEDGKNPCVVRSLVK